MYLYVTFLENMKNKQSIINYFINSILIVVVLGVFHSIKNTYLFETSLFASFLFYASFYNFSKFDHLNILYNFSHNKTLHK